MSALAPIADMCGATRYVRYGPIADSQSHPDQLLKSLQLQMHLDCDIALATALNDNSAVV